MASSKPSDVCLVHQTLRLPNGVCLSCTPPRVPGFTSDHNLLTVLSEWIKEEAGAGRRQFTIRTLGPGERPEFAYQLYIYPGETLWDALTRASLEASAPTEQPERAVPHVHEEGSRSHVLWWDGKGRHCTEPRCEVNRAAPTEQGGTLEDSRHIYCECGHSKRYHYTMTAPRVDGDGAPCDADYCTCGVFRLRALPSVSRPVEEFLPPAEAALALDAVTLKEVAEAIGRPEAWNDVSLGKYVREALRAPLSPPLREEERERIARELWRICREQYEATARSWGLPFGAEGGPWRDEWMENFGPLADRILAALRTEPEE